MSRLLVSGSPFLEHFLQIPEDRFAGGGGRKAEPEEIGGEAGRLY
jgi:hypothetical protein